MSDSAAYMLKAGRDLKIFFPQMYHVTCVAHGLHRVCELVRGMFPEVNDLISNVKKIFRKAPSRIVAWKETFPSLPLPPEPVLTRWGTWLEAVLFYAEHFEKVKEILGKFDPDDSYAIRKGQELLKMPFSKFKITLIETNCGFLISSLKKLETELCPFMQRFLC